MCMINLEKDRVTKSFQLFFFFCLVIYHSNIFLFYGYLTKSFQLFFFFLFGYISFKPIFILWIFKDVLPQNKNFLKVFSHQLCSPVNLLKHYIYALFQRLKQYFACFDCSIFLYFILLSCGIAHPVIQAETGDTASAPVVRSGQ